MYITKLLTENNNNNNNNMQTGTDADGAGFNVNKMNKESAHETVTFVDGDTPWSYDIVNTRDPSYSLAGFSDAELSNFLSRPVKIQEYQWTPAGTRLFQTFNPWTDFFSNADVLQKINRFRNLRCNLKIKVLVNGNSFYYGRALLSYNPFLLNDNVTKNRAFFEQDLVQASQKPHILLDPTTSQGGELVLPYIWPENWLDVTSANWEDDMGLCTIHDFDILRHANGGTDPITVVVFAWAEDVCLSVPTTSQAQSGCTNRPLDEFGFPIPYEEQSKKQQKNKKKAKTFNNQSNNDEFQNNGLISKPASTIAKVADALSMIPVLTPYAKATSMVASKIGQVAKIFGYSRPQVLHDTLSYTPRYMGNLCNTDAPEPLVKLSVDSKNELTIDSRVMGLGGYDELTINSIAQRPSYWRQFDWPESAVTDTLLTSMRVMPSYFQSLSAAPVVEIHPTALAFAATPFQFWQGSIKFRFNVVASEYHRGRLRIVYNPSTLPAGAIPFNQTYSSVVDISEDRDFEYEVKWADVRAWATTTGIKNMVGLTLFDDVNPIIGGTALDNGTLSVYVVNELATPSLTAADVKVQVWVSAGDDFAVAVPALDALNELSVYEQQSEIAPDTMATTTDTSNIPTSPDSVYSFGNAIKDDNQFLVYQGERIVSFRDLLRRYQYHYSYYPPEHGNSTERRLVSFRISDFPFYRGWDPNGPDLGLDSVLGNSPFTFSGMTLINYLTPAFALRRGALRHKVIFTSFTETSKYSLNVSRFSAGNAANSESVVSMNSNIAGSRRRAMTNSFRNTLAGSHITPVNNNPCLEYETPFYTLGQRFVPARDLDRYAGLGNGHEVSVEVAPNTDERDMRIDKYVSIAEDFQLGLFTGSPIWFVYVNPTAA